MTPDDPELARLLRRAVPPMPDADPPDLWPHMRRRLDRAPARIGWVEVALAAGIALALFFYPEIIPMLLYHL